MSDDYGEALRARIAGHLADFSPREHRDDSLRHAAVALALLADDEGAA